MIDQSDGNKIDQMYQTTRQNGSLSLRITSEDYLRCSTTSVDFLRGSAAGKTHKVVEPLECDSCSCLRRESKGEGRERKGKEKRASREM